MVKGFLLTFPQASDVVWYIILSLFLAMLITWIHKYDNLNSSPNTNGQKKTFLQYFSNKRMW